MEIWSPPRHTTEEERERMAQTARQHHKVMVEAKREEIRKREKQRKRRTRCCKVCDLKTEHGCPDCRTYICSPYLRDCYEVHLLETHERSQVG